MYLFCIFHLNAFFTNVFLQDVITNISNHYQNLLEGRNKEVAGSTYREIKNLIFSIINNGYFDWKPQPLEPEPKELEVVDPVQELPHVEPVRTRNSFSFV